MQIIDPVFDISFTYEGFLLKAACTPKLNENNVLDKYLVKLKTPNNDVYTLEYGINDRSGEVEQIFKDANVHPAILQTIQNFIMEMKRTQ